MTGDLNFSEVLNKLYPQEIAEAKIILRRLEYNGEVKQFRNAWHIKPEGFSGSSEFDRWWKNTLLPWANKWRAGEEYKDIQKRMKKDEGVIREYISKDPFLKFDLDLDIVIKKNKIPALFKEFVKQVLTLKPEAIQIIPGLRDFGEKHYERLYPLIRYNPVTERNELLIEITGRTNQEDFKSPRLWEKIREAQKKLHDYDSLPNFPAELFDISDKVAKWHIKDGLSYKEIKEKAKKELKYSFKTVNNVGTMIQRYKKYIGISTRQKRRKRT